MAFVDDLDLPKLADGDRHHLERALRVRPGAIITVGDGGGRWRAVRFGDDLEPEGSIVVEPPKARTLTIAFAPVKGDRSELVVQKLTELGIDRIVPVLTERSVVRWDEAKAAKNAERHRRIAREAAMQSRNPWLPTIEPLQSLAQFITGNPGALLADPAGTALADHRFPDAHPGAAPNESEGSPLLPNREAAVVIGPEGGFAPSELQGRIAVSLPGRILRTETAAIAAAVLLAAIDQ